MRLFDSSGEIVASGGDERANQAPKSPSTDSSLSNFVNELGHIDADLEDLFKNGDKMKLSQLLSAFNRAGKSNEALIGFLEDHSDKRDDFARHVDQYLQSGTDAQSTARRMIVELGL